MPRAPRSESSAAPIITAKKISPMAASAPYFSQVKGCSRKPT